MEITKVFKACVKAAIVKSKGQYRNDILPDMKSTKKGPVSLKATELAGNITKLKLFLLKHQTDYLGEFSHLVSISSKMTESERDRIDNDASTFIQTCSSAIASLKAEVFRYNGEKQVKSHYDAVVELLELYLKDVSKLYSQQRAYRVKQTVDRQRLSKLKPDVQKVQKVSVKSNLSTDLKEFSEHKSDVKKGIQTENKIQNIILPEESRQKEEYTFTAEETQMFEEENERLYEEMNNIVKEIKNIEGKVIEISQLQEIFQEKVLSQSLQIENLHQTAVSTTENVKEGNEQIREAIKNSATFRVWILFFLVMCTFSLLFLDWYND